MLWVDKYAPKCIQDVLNGEHAFNVIVSFLQSWQPTQSEPLGIMLSGPSGIGKSTVARLACAKANYDIILEIDVMRKNIANGIKEVSNAMASRGVSSHVESQTKNTHRIAVLVDDLDIVQHKVELLSAFIKKSSAPVLCICNNAHSTHFKSVTAVCKHVTMHRPDGIDMCVRLGHIARAENLRIPASVIRGIVTASGNDMRNAINQLQFGMQIRHMNMDRMSNPIDDFNKMFGATLDDALDLCDAHTTLGSEIVHQNYPFGSSQLWKTSDLISAADALQSRLKYSEIQSVCACAMPAFTAGRLSARPVYPKLIANTLQQTQNGERLNNLAKIMRPGQNRTDFLIDIVPTLSSYAVKPLLKRPSDTTVDKLVQYVDDCNLDAEQWAWLNDLNLQPCTSTMLKSRVFNKLTIRKKQKTQ